MIEKKLIKKCLENYIVLGTDKFILYPYGENGINVRNILRDYFEIEPFLIVDNEYYKFNHNICNFEALKESYDGSAYIILTIEDRAMNENMLSGILEFAPQENVINLLDLCVENQGLLNFFVDSFLPDIIFHSPRKQEMSTSLQKKVRFVNHTGSSWNSIKTICMAFQADGQSDVLIIGGAHTDEAAMKQVHDDGFRCVKWNEYNVEEDLPDILVLNHPYDMKTQIKDCREYCKLIVVSSMQLIRYCYSMKEFWCMQKKAFGRYHPDYYLFDSLLYEEIMRSEYASAKIVEMGNAKFDGIFEACKTKQYKRGWEKLKDKKVVLWTTDHGIDNGCVRRDLTFDLYAKVIFDYAKEHLDIGLIFRPHVTFIYEMLENGLWSEYDLRMLKEHCQKSPNIVFDDNPTYDEAFSVADCIIADAFCGITCSALSTLKPMCLTYRRREDVPYHAGLGKCHYAAYSGKDIISFIEMIRNNQDGMLEIRKQAFEKYIKHFDGKNGERIKEFICEKYKEMANEDMPRDGAG